MTTIVFSDTHLSGRVHRQKFAYLKSVIERGDRIIILGDFWDGFLTDFDKFLRSGWNKLFPLLLERQAIYLYGNHDRAEWSDERVSQFSVQQAHDLSMTIGGQSYLFSHGHSIKTSLEDKFPVLNHSVPLRVGSSLDILHKLVWGRRFLKADKTINQPMVNWATNNLPAPEILVCGHSHFPEVRLEERYLNDGFIGCGFGHFLRIDERGVELVREEY